MATKLMVPHDPSAQIAQEVQHLFETRTIEDMRKFESTTRKEVEDKRQELRKLIGARYRDLIESADSIGTMKQNADLLLSRISSMTNERDAASPWNPKVYTASETAAILKKQRLYSTGSKIKTVLETPESIWSALQHNSTLEATLLFHQAQLLHANISTDPEALLLFTSMPVATRQWNLVGQFPAKIDAASKAFLARPDQPPEQYASTLCALALLNKPAPSQILSEFLSSRTQLLDSLSQAASASKSKDSIVQSLGNYLAAIAHTFFLIYYIFTCPTAQPNSSVKATKTSKNSDSREIKRSQLHSTIPPAAPYFYFTLQTIKDDLDAIYKKHSIDNHEDVGSAAFFSLHIPSTSISTQIEHWLVGNTQKFRTLATQLLTHVVGAQSLAQVRDNVKTKIEDTVSTRDIPWATVSQSVSGREINLWELLCTDVFLTRAREIVAHSFETVDFESALTVILKNPSVGVGAGLWTAESARDDKDVATIQNKAAGLTPGVSEFVRKFDTMLATCLSDLTQLTQTIDTTPSSPIPPPSPSSRPPPSPRFHQSPMKTTQVVAIPAANPLEVYVQDRCFAGVTSFLGTVRKRLEVLQASILAAQPSASKTISITTVSLTTPTTPEEEETRKQVDESLLISQATRALGAYSKQLAAALVPQAPNGPTPSTPVRKARPQTDKGDETANARLVSIKKTLRQCYLHGYVLWAKWVTATHVHWLASCVNRDSWSDSTRRQGWEEHKVVIEGDDGTPVEEKLYLPYQPSPYVLEFLFAVCREIHRAGGHTIHRVALEYLARELATAVLDLYDNVALAHQGGGASKEGGVQLLCDACFLIDVLSVPDHSMQSDEDLRAVLPSINPSTDAGDSPSSTEGRWVQAMAWGRRVDKTVDTLKELLDPIDLAFYEAHVKSFVSRCYQRSSVLFGALIQLHRSQDSQTKASPVTDPNIIPLARPTARFGYLPTSVPAPSMMTPTKASHQPTSSASLASDKEGKKPLSFMEQTTGSLKKGFTSLNMLSSTFNITSSLSTSPQPSHPTSNSASTTPPKTSWFL